MREIRIKAFEKIWKIGGSEFEGLLNTNYVASLSIYYVKLR